MVTRRFATGLTAIAAVLASLVGLAPRAGAESSTGSEADTLTLAEAIAEATGRHPSVSAAEADRQIAEARRRQRGTDFIPTLEAEGSFFVWNDDLKFSVGPTGDGTDLPPPDGPYDAAVARLIEGFEPTVIREQLTWDVTLRLTQPLTPLWATYELWRARRLEERAAEANLDEAERDSARRVVVAYLKVLQAEAKLETARASVDQLEAQLDRVEAMVEAGTAQRADRLRIQVTLADSRQKVSRARSRLKLARSEFAVALGRDPGDPPDPAPVEPESLTAEPAPLQTLLGRAADNHPQLRELDLRLRQSRRAVRARRARMLPQLSGVAQYKHTEGRGLIAADEAFVGVSLNWQFLQWGRPLYAVDEARARRLKLEAQRRQTRNETELEVRRAWYDLQSALEAYEVTRRAVDRAEEAYRVESARFEAGRATPSDVLDAEAALTEARNNRQSAFYEILVNRTRLVDATGQPLRPSRLLNGHAESTE